MSLYIRALRYLFTSTLLPDTAHRVHVLMTDDCGLLLVVVIVRCVTACLPTNQPCALPVCEPFCVWRVACDV